MAARQFLCFILALLTAPAVAADRDRYGDALPPGAVARLGTLRFRIAPIDLATAPRLSPDGKTVAVADSRSVRLWDTATGNTIWRALVMGRPHQLVFSLDGSRLAVGDEWRVRLLNAKTGRLQLELDHRSPGDHVIGLAYSPDGKWLAVVSESRITVWDITTGDRVYEKNSKDEHRPIAVAFANERNHLIVVDEARISVWDWAKQVVLSETPLSVPEAQRVWFSSDGQILAVYSHKTDTIVLVDAKTGRELRTVTGDGRPTRGTAFSADGKRIVTAWQRHGEESVSVHVSSVETGKPVKTFQVAKHRIGSISCSADLSTLVTHGNDPTLIRSWDDAVIRLWDTETGRQTNILPAHDDAITGLAFTPDGSTIISGSRDATIRLWDAATGEHRRELPGHRSYVNSVAVTADGKAVLSCGVDAEVLMRDLATGKEIRRFDLRLVPEGPDPSVPHQVISISLSADGTRLSAYSKVQSDERAAYHLWDAATGRSLARRDFARSPTFLEFAPDGRSVLEYICPPNATQEQTQNMPLALCDLGTGRIRLLMPQPGEFEFSHALTQDGLTLATVTGKHVPRSMDENEVRYLIRLWDLPTGKEYSTIGADRDGLTHPVEAMAFSPEGRWLATAHSNRSVIIWNAQTGREEMTITGMDAHTRCLAFSPDGRRLVTGHTDSSALVWAVSTAAPSATPPSKAELESLWNALGDADARRARTALARLAENPKEAVAFLAERMTSASALPIDQIPGWLKDLSHPQFAKREAASRALAALGERVELHLIDFLATDPPPEARQRVERLLKAIPPIPPSDALRRMRAVPVLACADTSEARAILKRLAAGDPAARETSAARAALRGK